MRKRFDDEDKRPGGFWRFVKGVLFAVVVSAAAVVVLSVYVLPPPKLLEPEPVAETGSAQPGAGTVSPEVAAWMRRAKIHVRRAWVVPPEKYWQVVIHALLLSVKIPEYQAICLNQRWRRACQLRVLISGYSGRCRRLP